MVSHTVIAARQLRRARLALALSLTLTGGVAFAQSTVGSIYGNAAAGTTVQAENTGNGFSRQVTVGADGRFNIGSLPPGTYRLTVNENGTPSTHEVTVVAGQNLNLSPGASKSAKELGVVQVSANAMPSIDVAQVETATVFTAAQLRNLPIAQNQTAVALLAPGVTKGDAQFGNLASFNGSSVAENSYYVNGFNVTNQFNGLNYSQVPFQGIGQMEVKSGGYGARYGYSTGGVMSVITKRGSNEWTGGARVDWSPESLRANNPNLYYNNGRLATVREKNEQSERIASVWLGGPLIKDKLFFYALYSQTDTDRTTYGGTYSSPGNDLGSRGMLDDHWKDPYWLVKLDWNINDNNVLEYTGFSDVEHQSERVYKGGMDASKRPLRGSYQGTQYWKTGGRTDILNYTSYLTDTLTLTAMYGQLRSARTTYAVSKDGLYESYNGVVGDFNQPGCVTVADRRYPVATLKTLNPYASCNFASTFDKVGGKDDKKSGRIDLEWKLDSHDLHAGYTKDKWMSDTGQSLYEGGVYFYYYTRPTARGVDNSGSPETSYVRSIAFQTGGKVDIEQKAFYIEDNWAITDRFLAYVGVRNDGFNNKNGAGESYVKQSNIWQPRLGFSWDVMGDSSLKIYGTAGTYSLPIAANVALRAASASIYSIHDQYYTGVNPITGAPIGLQNIPDADPNHDRVAYAETYYANGANGRTPQASWVADKDLKPYKQDEFILGAQKQLDNDWTVGIRLMHRKLRNAIDDACDWRPFYNYAVNVLGLPPQSDANPGGVPESTPSGVPGCYIFNPGRGVDLNIPLTQDDADAGISRHVKLSSHDLGQPKAKRSFSSVELSAEKSWNDKWYVKASYVWAKSYGNTEGLVKSDIGQADTGTTQDFDYPELMYYSNGNLPNDRKHTIKVYGSWQVTPEWMVGANLLVQTGRPKNCFGVNEDWDAYAGYGSNASYFYCQGQPVARGSLGRTKTLWNLDLGVNYKPAWAKGLQLSMDITNVFNRHTPLTIDEAGETNATDYYQSTFGTPTSYQTPRYVRVAAQYDFSL